MGSFKTIKAADGHKLQAYVATPEGTPVGGLVVIQEIFGVNAHIRSVADGYAKDGFLVVAPALFDRIERGVDLNYDDEGLKKGFSLYPKLDPEKSLLDVAAAFVEAEELSGKGKDVGVVGFCYGGLVSWLTATRGETLKVQPACAVGYYAGGIGKFANEEPSCPVMLHFGAEDTHIGEDQIDAVRTAHPEVQIYIYEGAGHAFNREPHPAVYNAAAAKLARERTLEFLKANIA